MQVLTIKEIQTLAPGSPVLLTGGIVKGVSEYQTGDTEAGTWSLQEIMIEDETSSIPVKIGNHAEIGPDTVGKKLYFAAYRRPKGLTGLKIEEEEYSEKGTVKKFKVLSMARSGEILNEEQLAERNQTAAPAKAPAGTEPQPAPAPAPSQTEPAQELIPEVPKAKAGKMAVTELRYERLVNTGNYNSERMGVTIALEPGTKAVEALEAAKSFLSKHMAQEAVPVGAKPAKP